MSPAVVGEDALAAAQALSDPTRRDIRSVVLLQDQSVSELARRDPVSFAAVQRHVAVLTRAGW